MRGLPTERADRTTLMAFVALFVLVGSNLVAIRYSDRELAPLWGAGARFAIAALIFWAIALVGRRPVPRGLALAGSGLYGLLGFAVYFALIYYGLVDAPAGLGQIILALVPLLTMILATLQGLEAFRWRFVAGALVAVAGIAIVFGDASATAVPLPSLVALIAAAHAFAVTNIVVKRLPSTDPVATNAVATSVGGAVLLALSFLAGEPWVLPTMSATWISFVYLATIGTVVIFLIFLFLVRRWSPSAVSFQFVLAPFVAVALEAILANVPITPVFVLGGVLVIVGVYVGALAPTNQKSRPEGRLPIASENGDQSPLP